HQQSVEWILVVHWQCSDPVSVTSTDRQELDVGLLEVGEEIDVGIELSESALDRDLPDHDGADHDRLFAGIDRFFCLPTYSTWFASHPPEDDVGVEQKAQEFIPSDSARSGGNSSKSSAILTWPCH